MRKLLAALIATLGLARASEKIVEMREQSGPEGVFTIMVPTSWVASSTPNRVFVNAPNDGPALAGTAYRIERRPTLRECADARFQGVNEMGMYKQVGNERTLGGNGVLREYEGVWPGDKHITYYVVACKCVADVYAWVALTTSKSDFTANRVFYEHMLSTFEIHP